MEDTKTCILCGTHILSDLSLHPAALIMDLVKERHSRGPVVYPVIMSWDQPQMCACRLCFHQLRRRTKTQDASKKQPLPLDATLIQTFIPGETRQQDSRTRNRMRMALRTPGNGYSKSFEAIRLIMPENEHNPLKAWWDYNLQTEFFSHKTTAKLARKLGPALFQA